MPGAGLMSPCRRWSSGFAAHVIASAYHEVSWYPDGVPGLLPGVSTLSLDGQRRPDSLFGPFTQEE